jgi:hypothetical protein
MLAVGGTMEILARRVSVVFAGTVESEKLTMSTTPVDPD